MTFDDTQLRAYLAGELPADIAAVLEAAIEKDELLADRLFELDVEVAAPLRNAMKDVPTQSRLDAIANTLPKEPELVLPNPVMHWAPMAAAAVAAFALGAFLFGTRANEVPDRWQEQAAIYQALYVTETVAPINFSETAVAQQVADSSAALGRDLPLDVVTSLEGLTLKRSQVLGFEGAPLIQLAYISADGVPVALCAIRLGEANAQTATFETLAGLPSAHWSDGTYSFMIIGDLPADTIESLTENLQRQL